MKPDRMRCAKSILLVLSVLAALKMIFFAFGLDEEYQLVMAYRNIKGDRLFLDMWEPHQTSAFLCSLLMRPYLALNGTTGIVLYLRVWGTLIHLGISIYLYKILKRIIHKDCAFLLGLIFFNTMPKQIIMPEFGIMQVWFFTLMMLFLAEYYDRDVRRKRYLILAAVSLVLEVLSYPSCILLFFFLLWVIWRHSGDRRISDIGIATGICAVCGAAYLAWILRYNSIEGLLQAIGYMINGDVTHSLPFAEKWLIRGKEAVIQLLICAGIFLAAEAASRLPICRKYGIRKQRRLVFIVLFSCAAELFSWVVLNSGFEVMQVHLLVFTIAGLFYWKRSARKKPEMENAAERDADIGETGKETLYIGLFLDGIIGSGISLFAVVYLTDLGIRDSISHAMLAAFLGMAFVVLWWEKQGKQSFIYMVLAIWALTAVFGKGYSLRSAPEYHNVLESRGILKYGPAAGTISNYMTAYIYNCDYEDWQNAVQDGDRVLIMVDQVMNLGTIQYLFKDVDISHFSIVNPTAYDDRLPAYWELFPEKTPNVIIVDAWYGDLLIDPECWMMKYIETEFGYNSVTDGRYIRIYRK